jgi:dTDP-4-dehydrorhamnose reductase
MVVAAAEGAGGARVTRWLVTGARGMLGSHLVAALAGAEVVALPRAHLDVSDERAVSAILDGTRPDVVVNAAAWTDVDGAETHEAAAAAVNALGPACLARACATMGAKLLHVSTDYVFAGDATIPYAEDAAVAPRSAYGRTKAAGERAVLTAGALAYVVRTAWLYGASGRSFVRTMLRLAAGDQPVDVVDDQRGSPTWAGDLAEALVILAASDAPAGIYHWVNGGQASWYELAQAVFAAVGADPCRVRPTTSARMPRPAPRPAFSVLSTGRWEQAGLPRPRPWRDALEQAIAARSVTA